MGRATICPYMSSGTSYGVCVKEGCGCWDKSREGCGTRRMEAITGLELSHGGVVQYDDLDGTTVTNSVAEEVIKSTINPKKKKKGAK